MNSSAVACIKAHKPRAGSEKREKPIARVEWLIYFLSLSLDAAATQFSQYTSGRDIRNPGRAIDASADIYACAKGLYVCVCVCGSMRLTRQLPTPVAY